MGENERGERGLIKALTGSHLGQEIAGIEEGINRPRRAHHGRVFGADGPVVLVLTCGPGLSVEEGEKKKEKKRGLLLGCGDVSGPVLGRLGRLAFSIFFVLFLLFYFLFSEIQITFEIIVQIDSNQFE